MLHIKQLYTYFFFQIIFQGIFSAWKKKMPELFEIVTGRHIVVALAIHSWVWILNFSPCQWNKFYLLNPLPIHWYIPVFYGCSVGPWTSCDAGETVSVVARSNYREIIITGDNTGRMKVFKYPSSTNMVTYDLLAFILYPLSNLFSWILGVESLCYPFLLIIFLKQMI